MKKLLSVLVLIVLFGSLAFCQDFAKKGVLEFGGTAGFQSQTPVMNGETGDALSTVVFEPSLGYFIIDGLEIGFNPLSIVSMSSGGESATLIGAWAFGAYHFTTMGKTYPYIEALIGYTSASAEGESAGGLAFGGGAGAKFEIVGGLLLNAGIDYRLYSYDDADTDGRDGFNTFSLVIGLSGFLTP